jgi:uncharacterized protein YjbI with pentapeptide repeats
MKVLLHFVLYLFIKGLVLLQNLQDIYQKLFSKVRKSIEHTPTQLFVTGAVVILALIAIWVEEDTSIQSPRDVVKILFEHAESIAIVAAVILYFKEIPERKAQKHYEAWQVIDNAAAARVPTSHARFKALEDLNQEGVLLNGIVIPEANLQGINLKFANLFDANLTDANLSEANLIQAKLFRSILAEANLFQANLTGADLRGANLVKAKLTGAKLAGADLTGAKLTGAKLAGADLTGADLTGVDFTGANLFGTVFSNARFFDANLTGCNFSNTNLTGAKLLGANLAKSDFSKAIGLSHAEVKESKNWENAIYDPEFRIQLGLPPEN